MLLAAVLTSALLFCSVAGQQCSTFMGIRNINHLINNLQKDPLSTCRCSANVTSCLCLPIPSDNCTTPCFQEGLSQMTNITQKTEFLLIFNRVKRTVEVLKNNKCPLQRPAKSRWDPPHEAGIISEAQSLGLCGYFRGKILALGFPKVKLLALGIGYGRDGTEERKRAAPAVPEPV
ncbi:interleukin-9 [Erethizon dorsatum]